MKGCILIRLVTLYQYRRIFSDHNFEVGHI